MSPSWKGAEDVKNDGKENNDKGELIDGTAWFPRLTYTSFNPSFTRGGGSADPQRFFFDNF